MPEVQDTKCPLCTRDAKVEHHVARRSQHYLCTNCGELVIKEGAAKWLSTAPAQKIEDFVAAAMKTPQGEVLFLCRLSGPDPGGTTVQGEHLSTDEALRR